MEILPRQVVLGTPVAEPVTLDEAKAHLRVDFSEDDTLIQSQITACREWMEKALNLTMVERTATIYAPHFAECFQLPYTPLQSVSSVQYWSYDSPSTLETASTDLYRVDTLNGQVYRAYSEYWPSTAVRHDAVQIAVTVGHPPAGSPLDYGANVPESLKAALLLLLGNVYEHREEHITGTIISTFPTAKMLMQTYRNY